MFKNLLYNPRGKLVAENFSFPFEDCTFDIIFVKSVFTHILPKEVDNYLKQITRLLSHASAQVERRKMCLYD